MRLHRRPPPTSWLLVAVLTLVAVVLPLGTAPRAFGQPPGSALTYNQTVLLDTPRGYWRLGETSGTTAADSSGNGIAGTYVSTIGLGRPGALTGDPNTAIAFDGSTGYVGLPNHALLNPTAISVEAWVNVASFTGSYPRLVSKTGQYELVLYTVAGNQGRLEWDVYTPAQNTLITNLADALALNTWYHLVATYDGSTANIYINGTLKATRAIAGTLATAAGNGATIGYNGRYVPMAVDEVAIYGATLTAAQVQAHYLAGTTPPPTATPTVTGTPTNTPTASKTPTASGTPTPGPSPTPTNTPAATSTPTTTGTPTRTATATPRPTGAVIGWGNNTGGQTGPPAGLSGVVTVAGGQHHSLALKSDGTVVAWGYNGSGQTSVPAGLSGVSAIAAGDYHSLALKSDGTVAAWGYNAYAQTDVPAGLSSVTAIAAGSFHNLALKSNGTVAAWGYNASGQTTVPAGLTGVIGVAAGAAHSLALKSDGTVVAWGYNGNNQTSLPAGLSGVTAVAAGGWHSLALKSNGTVVAWGDNTWGQRTVPAGLSGVVAVAAGSGYSLALKSDGTVVAWGDNSSGQRTPPAGLTGVIAIAAGAAHGLAVSPVAPPTPTATSTATRTPTPTTTATPTITPTITPTPTQTASPSAGSTTFTVTQLALPSTTGSSQTATIATTNLPMNASGVQLNLQHPGFVQIAAPACAGVMAGANPTGPQAVTGGTIVGCFFPPGTPGTVSGPTGPVMTVQLVRLGPGAGTVSFGTGQGATATQYAAGGLTLGPGTTNSLQIITPNVAGTVTLQGRQPDDPPGVGHGIATVTAGGLSVPTGADGSFSLTGLADGSYTLAASAVGYLSASRTISVNAGVATGGPLAVQLRAGDVLNHSAVAINDLTALVANYGLTTTNRLNGQGWVVDLNGNGVVDINDLTAAVSSFGLTAPQPWP